MINAPGETVCEVMKRRILFVALFIIVSCKKEIDTDVSVVTDPLPIKWEEWVFEGDSITDLSSGLPDNYPHQLQLLDTATAKAKQIDVALSGDKIQNIILEYQSQVHPYRPADNSHNYIFAIMAGINDAIANRSATDIYKDLRTEWGYARADGFKVMAFCMTRSTNGVANTTGAQVNDMMINNPQDYDYLIRTDQILPDATNTVLFRDGLHPTTTGSIIIAQEVLRVLKIH